MRVKRILSTLMCLTLIIAMLPSAARAAQGSDFTVIGDAAGYTYGASGVLTFTQDGSYTVEMAGGVTQTTTDRIVVNSGVTANITLSGVDIDRSIAGGCAFELQGTSVVSLTLSGNNNLTSGTNNAGLQVPENAILSITGGSTDTLTATGAILGAGIGTKDNGGNCGAVTINGGTIIASSGGGAGIGSGGGGIRGDGGTVTITGGAVRANSFNGAGIGCGDNGINTGNGGIVTISGGTLEVSSNNGAGIGGSVNGNGATVTITGGSVHATSTNGMAIGCGSSGPDSGTLTNGSGADVYLTTVTLDGVSAVTAVSALTTGLEYAYGTNDMKTDASGKLYLYLPDDSVTYGAQTAAQGYSGNVETKTDPTSSLGTLSADSVVPTVSAVTPTGTGAALSGSIVITFSEPMNTGAGAVSLDGGGTTLAAGSWNADKTVYTASYSGLSYGTACTVAISGFKDAAGNVMTADTGHSFTTGTAPVGGGGGTSGSNTQNQPVISVDRGTATVTVKAVLNGDGTLDASLTGAAIADALQKAAASAGESGTVVLELVIDGPASAFGMTLKLPSSALGSMTGGALDLLTLKTPMGTFSFDAETLAQIARQANGDLEIAVSAVDPSTLSEDARELVGTRPVYDFSITSGSTAISDFGGGTVTVSLPYTPADGEDPDNIVVYYISDSGEPVTVPNCIYDAKTGTVTFTTTHFSVYAVGYNDVSFSDVSGWYEECVDFVAARGIMNGVGADRFDPDGTMTRAMFVTILHRLGGETGSYTNAFSDVPSGEWYENAVAWAGETGIAGGVGNGLFNPNAEITREQLAVMLYRYAQHMGYDVSVGEDTNILSYSDALTISDYAYSALQWACGAGIMDGDDGGNLYPRSSAARAQAAAMLQRFILNTIS